MLMNDGIMRKIAHIMTLVVATMVAAPYVFVTTGMIDRLNQMVTVAAFVCVLLMVLFEGRFRKPTAAHWLILAFFVWQIITVFWTKFLGATVYRTLVNTEFLIDIWIFWEIGSAGKIGSIAQAYVLGAYASAVNTIKNLVTGQALSQSTMDRYTSFGHDPNEEGIRLIVAILLAFLLCRGTENRAIRTINYAGVVLCCFAVLLGGSRTAFVALAIPAIILIINTSGYKRAAAVAAVAATLVAVPFVVPSASIERMTSVGRNIERREFSERQFIWQVVPSLFSKSPVIGLGANTFAPEMCQVSGFQRPAHNVYMSILVEEGAVGLIIFAAIIAVLITYCNRLEKHERRLWLAMLAAWGVGSLTLSLDFELITWILFGLIITATHQSTPARVLAWREAPAAASIDRRAG